MTSKMIGDVEIFVDDAEKYLQINDIDAPDLRRVWGFLDDEEFGGYERFLCFHNTDPPADVLEEVGAVLVDDNLEMRLTPENFVPASVTNVHRLADEDFGAFANLHDKLNPDMYWNGERIAKDLTRWAIFAVQRCGGIVAYAMLALWNREIYKVEAESADQYADLITTVAKHAFSDGALEVLYTVDKADPYAEVAEAVGFAVTGFYKGYKT